MEISPGVPVAIPADVQSEIHPGLAIPSGNPLGIVLGVPLGILPRVELGITSEVQSTIALGLLL